MKPRLLFLFFSFCIIRYHSLTPSPSPSSSSLPPDHVDLSSTSSTGCFVPLPWFTPDATQQVVNHISSTASVALRLISRNLREEQGRWGFDETCLIFAMAVVLARSVYITYCIHLGFGRHLHPLLEADVVGTVWLTRHLVILEALSLWTWALPKLPVAILLFRIFGKFKRGLGIILYSLVAFLIAIVVVQTVVTFVKCQPISKNWNPTVPGRCWNTDIYTDIGYFAGAYSAALDFGFALFASTQVFGLQMERSRKMLIAASLSLGIPAGVTTCIKLAMIASLNTSDITYSTVPLEVWNSVESCALMVAACVPATRPVMRLLGKRLGEWRSLISGRKSHSSAKTESSSGVSSKDRAGELELGRRGQQQQQRRWT
ncbi:hypothetical protein L249_8039 [Ophiocordyceps polyrhachis-furcata BCC 54312]|uniref:Rhodopsin domain-containing protein n=1 Tax=Ophiocordyceps polyrhachis-furcata BCC 54312 TaxID=1330021 RepID=A0A367LHZ8_9HYPO|nr:hypothetical protein L249_8039 [Ophiocordyceps polyrhachis-furcata BCC 54312]